MERLTKKHYGAADYCMGCSENCANDAEMCGGCPWLERIINRLGAYEDTGLEPQEIEEAMSDCADTVAVNQFAIKDIQDLGGIEHLRELVQAEKDGRLVVLPCKVGDTVWFIRSAFSRAPFPIEANHVSIRGIDGNGEVLYASITAYNKIERRFKSSDIGKTVFLNHKDAEAALKSGGENG